MVLRVTLTFDVLTHRLVQQGQVIEAGRRVGMFRPKDFQQRWKLPQAITNGSWLILR
jgi:hypothetical protein